MYPPRTDSGPLVLFTGSGGSLQTGKGKHLAPLTLRAYGNDLRSVFEMLADGRKMDMAAEAAAWSVRAKWAAARQSSNDAAPAPTSKDRVTSTDTVVGEFFGLTPERARRLIQQMRDAGKSDSTICRRIAGLRAIWRNLKRMNMVDTEPFEGISRHLPRVRRVVSPASPEIWLFLESTTPEDALRLPRIAPLLVGKGQRVLILRDLAMACLFMMEGLKPAELSLLTEGDFIPPVANTAGQLRILRGKQELTLQLTAATSRYLIALISALYPEVVLTVGDGSRSKGSAELPVPKEMKRPLFPNKHRDRQVSSRSMRRKLELLFNRLDLDPASPARLRHAAIIVAILEGGTDRDVAARFFHTAIHSLGEYRQLASGWQDQRAALQALTAARVVEPKPATNIARPVARTTGATRTSATPAASSAGSSSGHPVYGRATALGNPADGAPNRAVAGC